MRRSLSFLGAAALVAATITPAFAEQYSVHSGATYTDEAGLQTYHSVNAPLDEFIDPPMNLLNDTIPATADVDQEEEQEYHTMDTSPDRDAILDDLYNDVSSAQNSAQVQAMLEKVFQFLHEQNADDVDVDDDTSVDNDDEDIEYDEEYDTQMDSDEEVPPNNSQGSGEGEFHLMDNDLHYMLNVQDLSSPITGAHFHHAEEDEPGPVVEPITMSGSTAEAVWMDLTPEQLEWLDDEEIYVNVHTVNFPEGEIRGQVE